MAAFPEEYNSDMEFLIGARKGFYDRSRLLSPEATLTTIQDLKEWIGQELAFEEGASASFGKILSELWHAQYLDQLSPLMNRFERLAAAYFVRRGSVTAFHGFCCAWQQGLFRRILQFAEEGPELDDLGHAPGPYALLASGSLGRREQSLEEAERYFLVWSGTDAEYFERFAYRVIAILDHYGVIAKEGSSFLGKALWRGSQDEWRAYLHGEAQESEQPDRLEIIADLRHLCGDEAIGHQAVLQARSALERSSGSDQYLKQARDIVAAPMPLGILGSIRVEKSGERVGCCNPEQSGLWPLVSAVRLLAVRSGLDPCSTLDRIKELGALGVLERAQVERLSSAYQVLAGIKVRREIALEQPYLDPSSLTEVERERLRGALDAVGQLQRLVRCIFLGKDRRVQRPGNS